MKTPRSDRDRLLETLAELACHPELARDNWDGFCEGVGANTLWVWEGDLRRWHAWWRDSGLDLHLPSAKCVQRYASDLEAAGRSVGSMLRTMGVLRRLLAAVGWPDPDAEVVIDRVISAKSHLSRLQRLGPRPEGTGWSQIQACVEAVDQTNIIEVRAIAILLLAYDSLARAEEVFGLRRRGVSYAPPMSFGDLTTLPDGSGVLQWARGSHQPAYLSPMTMAWLGRWLRVRPARSLGLFPTLRGTQLMSGGWFLQIGTIAERAGLDPKTLKLSAVRLGAARALLQAGTSPEDVRRAGRWRQLNSVLRLMDTPTREQPMRHLAQLQGRTTPLPVVEPSLQALSGELFLAA
jgi:integrase